MTHFDKEGIALSPDLNEPMKTARLMSTFTKGDFVADYVGYVPCMIWPHTFPRWSRYRAKQKSEGGRFFFVADGVCLCEEHYQELPDE